MSRIFTGHIHLFHAFDIGDDINFEQIKKEQLLIRKPTPLPRYFKNYHKPFSAELPHPHARSYEGHVRLHQFGALSLQYKVPFELTFEELREFFALDIQPRVVGVTPDIWNPERPQPFLRESECMAWLAANRPTGTRWLAIDDRPLWFQPNCPNLLVTDTTQGFLPNQIEMLRVMLMQSFGGR